MRIYGAYCLDVGQFTREILCKHMRSCMLKSTMMARDNFIAKILILCFLLRKTQNQDVAMMESPCVVVLTMIKRVSTQSMTFP